MTIQSEIRSNVTKSYFFMTLFIGLIILLSYVAGHALGYGNSLVFVGVIFSVVSSFASYWWGDRIVLTMSGAVPADRKKHFDFFTVAENLSISAGIPKPRLYVIEDSAMNAFATGRDPAHAVVCATTGILARLDRRELEGVIAHELSHVKNYDIRFMAVVAVLAGTLVYIADMFLRSMWWGRGRDRENNGAGIFMIIGIVLAVITPVLSALMQLAISRRRELLADASGAYLTRYPEGLARALEKIAADKEVLEAATNATAHLYITNPFKDKEYSAWFASLFDTHPPLKERIRLLRSM